ncbi:MAG: M23 family metallopeptidase [Oscillospiraceae bacterium]|nr:M23 family metallopeptidase [Oscillospiraceae bacterium]
MKKRNLEKIGNFLSGRGFYIVLFLCVAAIGISGYLLFKSPSSGNDASMNLEDPGAAVAHPTEVVISASPVPKASAKSSETKASPSAPATVSPSADSKTTAEAKTSFVWPVSGDVVTAFSNDKLVYNSTLKDWRTHESMDLAANVGAKVMAVSAGTVSQVYDDELMGTTVVIKHENNLTSAYSNLAKLPTVSVGDKVMAGDVIGAVGATAVSENGLPSHLHFAMTAKGAAVNPEKYLPER